MKRVLIALCLAAPIAAAQTSIQGTSIQIGGGGPQGPKGDTGATGPAGTTTATGANGGFTVPGDLYGGTFSSGPERHVINSIVNPTTLAAQIALACSTNPIGTVVIDANYTGTESVNSTANSCGARIIDRRTTGTFALENSASLWYAALGATKRLRGSNDFRHTIDAAQKGSINVAIVGNSIGEAVSAIGNMDSFAQHICTTLRSRYQNVTVNCQNFAIGGTGVGNFIDQNYKCGTSFTRAAKNTLYNTEVLFLAGDEWVTWPNGCTAGTSWSDTVKAFSADLVIANWPENAIGQPYFGFHNDLSNFIKMVNRADPSVPGYWTKEADVVLYTDIVPYPDGPTVTDPNKITENYNDVVRGLCGEPNLGCMVADASALFSSAVYGTDPNQRMTNVEHNLINYPTGWTTYSGVAPTYASGANLSSSLTYGGSGGISYRARTAKDGLIQASFSSIAATAQPTIQYRISADTSEKYTIQGTVTAGTWNGQLYECLVNVCTGVAGTTFACATSGGLISGTAVFVGTEHKFYCNGTLAYDVYEYSVIAAGYEGVGVQVSNGQVSQVNLYIGNPIAPQNQNLAARSFYGTFCSTYQGSGDYQTNPFSIGGDCVHHVNAIAQWESYITAFGAVLDRMDSAVAPRPGYLVTRNNGVGQFGTAEGGLMDSGAGQVDAVAGPNGLRIMGNNRSTVGASWAGGSTDYLSVQVPLAVGALPVAADGGGTASGCTVTAGKYRTLDMLTSSGHVTVKVAVCD